MAGLNGGIAYISTSATVVLFLNTSVIDQSRAMT